MSNFNDIYWAAQPLPVQALRNMSGDERMRTAISLATQGYSIDTQIEGWGWDPEQVMTLRQQYGYTWVPALLQPSVAMAPGLNTPGLTVYDAAHPPAGSIFVSTNPADYPPFVNPTPTVHPGTPTSLVGIDEGAGYFAALPAAATTLPNGSTYTADPRGTFVFHLVATPFGNTMYFQKV